MSIQEIFSQLSGHMIKGLMVHEQLANYYDFLGLNGFRIEHEHQYIEESSSYRSLCHFYVNHYNRLIEESRVENPKIIPDSWYRYSRFDVDSTTKRNGIENGFKEWKNWETETRQVYESLYCELFKMGEISASMFVQKLIEDVENELKRIDKEILELKATSYDMTYIMELQN